jgi:hypothetical protein
MKENFKQISTSATKRINVTDITSNQRRNLFINCINQNGFIGFIKNYERKQTYYTFYYENTPNSPLTIVFSSKTLGRRLRTKNLEHKSRL